MRPLVLNWCFAPEAAAAVRRLGSLGARPCVTLSAMVPLIIGLLLVGAVVVAFFAFRRSRPRPFTIDSFVLSEPWRRHVSSTQSIQRTYGTIVAGTPAGPLHDRLTAVTVQLQRSVDECWQIANRGDEIDEALHRLKPSTLKAQFEHASDDDARTSLQAQLDSAARLTTLRDEADQRLTALNTRLGELVTQATEVSVGIDPTEALGSGVDDVVTQLQALRMAVDEINDSGRPPILP